MRHSAILLAPLLAIASPAGAAVLWTTTFTGTDGTNRNLVVTGGVPAFTDSLTADDANLAFQDTSFSGTVFMHSGTMAAGDHYSPNTNVDNPGVASPQNGGWWQAEFRFSGGTQTVSLDSIVLDVAWSNNLGNVQSIASAGTRDITLSTEYSLDGGTNWFAVSAAQTYNLTVVGSAAAQYQDRTFTPASAIVVDHALQDLWLRVRAENSGTSTGAYLNLRDITFNGTVVPEPSTALLGGIGLLALLRRRRS